MTDDPTPPARPLRLLVTGHRSFAAAGLVDLLRGRGHDVCTFSRGPVAAADQAVTGDVNAMATNPHLPPRVDAVVNYLIVKDGTVADNEAYLASLLAYCSAAGVRQLVHLSSVSVFAGHVRRVTEDADVEPDPRRKGAYASLKVAADLYLLKHRPAGLRLDLVRPGFILGPGHGDPMVGMGFRLGHNRVLLFGDARNHLPLTDRPTVNAVVAAVLDRADRADPADVGSHLVLDPDAPSRREWLEACGQILGAGARVVSLPRWVWRLAGLGGEPVARLARLPVRPARMMRNATRRQTFDSSATQRRLGVPMGLDWRRQLRDSFPGQASNVVVPAAPGDPPGLGGLGTVSFIGFGQIVAQRHLPALRRLGFGGPVHAYDVRAVTAGATPIQSHPIDSAGLVGSDLVIVASPGPLHAAAIPLLQTQPAATAVIEKPLCYQPEELDRWLAFAAARPAPVYVCHNYRFKRNVRRMLTHLHGHNAGRLIRCDVQFQSPSITKEWRTWTRDERRARTLLMDYSVHLLDVACMFDPQGGWSLARSRFELDGNGHTSLIEGEFAGPAYRVGFTLRQGFMPRRTRLTYQFQNYTAALGFAPDTFVAHMADENPGLHRAEARAAGRAFRTKVVDKLLHRESDRSHDGLIAAAATRDPAADPVTVPNLANFYRALLHLAEAVYGPEAEPRP